MFFSGRRGYLPLLQLETLLGGKLLEFGIGRDLGALTGLVSSGRGGSSTYLQLETLLGEELLEVSIGRDLGALKGLVFLDDGAP